MDFLKRCNSEGDLQQWLKTTEIMFPKAHSEPCLTEWMKEELWESLVKLHDKNQKGKERS